MRVQISLSCVAVGQVLQYMCARTTKGPAHMYCSTDALLLLDE